jgi:hypothetical protein
MNWIDLTQGRDRSRALVNGAKNSRVHQLRGIPRLAEQMLDFQGSLCSIELVS